MSKFSDRLSNLGQSAPARMGFGRATAREKNSVMLVIGKGGDASKAAGNVDVLLGKSGTKDSGDWGLLLDGPENVDPEQLEKDGCQFLLIVSEDASAEALLADDIAKGLPVTDGMPEHRVRAIEDGPFDFLLYRPESITWPLTIGSVLRLQDLISSFSKHIFLELPRNAALPGKKDLEVLKNMPVSAIVVDLDATDSAEVGKMKEAIANLEPRKPSGKGDRSPFVPAAGRSTSEDFESDDGGGDWDDDDDDY